MQRLLRGRRRKHNLHRPRRPRLPNLPQHPPQPIESTARKAGGTQQDYIIITLEEVLITSFHTGGSEGAFPFDQVTCSYKKIKIEYKVQKGTGDSGASKNVTWDIKAGKAQN